MVTKDLKYRDIGERIQRFAKAKGFNNSALAREVGVVRSNVGGWISGEYRPDGENLEKLAEVLGVSQSSILGLESKPKIDPVHLLTALTKARAARDDLDEAIRALESAQVDNVVRPDPGLWGGASVAADGGKEVDSGMVGETIGKRGANPVNPPDVEGYEKEGTDLGDGS